MLLHLARRHKQRMGVHSLELIKDYHAPCRSFQKKQYSSFLYRHLTFSLCKWQIDVSCLYVCPHIEYWLRNNLVKAARGNAKKIFLLWPRQDMILSSIRHEKKNWRNFLVITITNVIRKVPFPCLRERNTPKPVCEYIYEFYSSWQHLSKFYWPTNWHLSSSQGYAAIYATNFNKLKFCVCPLIDVKKKPITVL